MLAHEDSTGGERGRSSPRRSVEILDAAALVFARLGYHGASTRDIAERLGIRQASVYYYFRSKEAALEAVCARAIGVFLAGGQRILVDSGTSVDKLRALIRQHLAAMSESPDPSRVFLTQRRFLQGEARERIRRLSREYEAIVETVIAQGVASGEFRRDIPARDLMLAVIGMCNAANMWHGLVSGMSAERAIRTVTPLLVDGLVGAGQARGAGRAAREALHR